MAQPAPLALALAAAALLAAGCGSSKQATPPPASTVTRTVTTTAPAVTVTQPPAQSGSGVASVVARVLPSVVNVRVKTFDGGEAEGSGVVIDRRGVIVTNNHVIEGASSLSVVFNEPRHRRPLSAVVVGSAPERDLAVIRVPAADLTPIRRGSSSALRLGDGVIAIGFPLDLGGPTVTAGIVSGVGRTLEAGGGPPLEGLLQTDAAINPGNSGGPLVDLAGRLVGINTARGRGENIGFAIAIDDAWPVIQEIRKKPPGQRAWLGVTLDTVGDSFAAAQLGLDPDVRGAVVISVYGGGPAAAAGLREGDVITAVDGKAVTSTADVTGALSGLKPGTRVTLDVVDTLGPRRVGVVLARRPATLSG